MTTEMMFVRFRETNDNEGEAWNWWIQLTGNVQQLAKLAGLLAVLDTGLDEEFADDAPFTLLRDQVEPRSVVDKLVQYAESGYYASHNVVTGTFTCPDGLGEYGDALYKGGIRDFFAPAGSPDGGTA